MACKLENQLRLLFQASLAETEEVYSSGVLALPFLSRSGLSQQVLAGRIQTVGVGSAVPSA